MPWSESDAPDESRPRRHFVGKLLNALLGRFVLGVGVILLLAPTCVDEFFRVFHAIYWADRPQLAPSTIWLPGYTWFLGSSIRILGDTVVVPRLLALGCFVMTLAGVGALTRARNSLFVMLWLGLSPLGWLVGSTALSEAFFGLLLVASLLTLTRYRAHGHLATGLASSLCFLLLTWTRYDAWVLVPAFAGYHLASSRSHGRLLFRWPLALVAAAGPVLWMLVSYTRRGDPLWFLTSVQSDQFGAGTISAGGLGQLVVVTMALLGCLAVGWAAWRSAGAQRLLAVHGICAAGFVLWVLASGNIPSQRPERLFYPLLLLSAPAVAMAAPIQRRWLPILTSIVLLGSSVVYLLQLPAAIGKAEAAVTSIVRDAYEAELLGADAHVVVAGPYPDVTAIVVGANRPTLIHIYDVGRRCPLRLLDCTSPCGEPVWAEQTRLVVAGTGATQDAMRRRGWPAIAEHLPYRVFARPTAGPPICPITPAQ